MFCQNVTPAQGDPLAGEEQTGKFELKIMNQGNVRTQELVFRDSPITI
jgi:hypothetical protein